MRALILGGGGSRGAYAVGVLKYLTGVRELSWDLIAGISVGALNGGYLAQFPAYEQKIAARKLENIWRGIKGSNSIYKSWLPSIVPSFVGYISSFWTGGLFSTSPLKKLIKNNFTENSFRSSGVGLMVGAVSATTGECRYVNQNDDNLLDWIVASSAYPVAFPPVYIEHDLWIDGGMKKGALPLASIMEMNPTEIDIVLTAPVKNEFTSKTKPRGGALGIAIKTVQILNEDVFPFALLKQCEARGIKVNIYAPDQNLGVDLLNFSPEIISALIHRGYEDAIKQFR